MIGFAIPGDLETPTGGYVYTRRIIEALTALGRRVELVPLAASFPAPSAAERQAALAAIVAAAARVTVVVDGLALGALPELSASPAAGRLVALIHHPLARESGPSRAVFVAEVNGRPVAESPLAASLTREGFVGTAMGYQLRRR